MLWTDTLVNFSDLHKRKHIKKVYQEVKKLKSLFSGVADGGFYLYYISIEHTLAWRTKSASYGGFILMLSCKRKSTFYLFKYVKTRLKKIQRAFILTNKVSCLSNAF